MKQKLTLILMCMMTGMVMKAQTWTRTLSTSNPDNEVGIVEAPGQAGTLINVNNVTVSGSSDVVITKLNPDGTIVWSRTYGISGGGSEIASSFILDRDTNIVVVGSVLKSGAQRGFLMKVNFSTGAVMFAKVTTSTNSAALIRKVIQMNAGYSNDYAILGEFSTARQFRSQCSSLHRYESVSAIYHFIGR